MTNREKATGSESYPLLSQIDSPDDLRALKQNRLPEVCADIRRFLIDSLSENPGHFASSMGAVELTVALHYVFRTPYDRIVWDAVSYTHLDVYKRQACDSSISSIESGSSFTMISCLLTMLRVSIS